MMNQIDSKSFPKLTPERILLVKEVDTDNEDEKRAAVAPLVQEFLRSHVPPVDGHKCEYRNDVTINEIMAASSENAEIIKILEEQAKLYA